MNYIRIYNEIIVNAKFRNKPDCYCEKHHIIPKCLGGTNEESNLVILTAREHFIVHYLLYKIYPNNNKIFFALSAMNMVERWNNSSVKRYKPKLTSKQYEQLRQNRSIIISKCLKGRIVSEETKKKLSKINIGKHLSNEAKFKIAESNSKIIHTLEWNEKVGESLKKHKRTAEHSANISKAKKGKHINYNMNSAGFKGTQSGVNNYQAIKCYVDGILIGCVNDLQNWLKTNYISYKFRICEPWEYIKNNNYHINTNEYEMLLLKCMNTYPMMKNKHEILTKIKRENIINFLQNNEIKFLKNYLAPHQIGNTQVKV